MKEFAVLVAVLTLVSGCSKEPETSGVDLPMHTPNVANASFQCEDGRQLTIQYGNRRASMIMQGYPVEMEQQPAAEGYLYTTQDLRFEQVGDTATLHVAALNVACTLQN